MFIGQLSMFYQSDENAVISAGIVLL